MQVGERYTNVRTNTLIEVFNGGVGRVTVATVHFDGYGPKRRVGTSSFRDSYLDSGGRPYTVGYVPVKSLPGDHPHAMKTESANMDLDLIDHLDELGDDDLAALIDRQQVIQSQAKSLIEKAKAVAKSRTAGTGTQIHGDVAMVFTTSAKFDALTARKNLSAEDFRKICILKPDATLAKGVFKFEPDKLKLCQKDEGLTLTVRKATEKDRESVMLHSLPTDDIEVFDGPAF